MTANYGTREEIVTEAGTPACGLKLLGKLADIRGFCASHADPARATRAARRAGAGPRTWGVAPAALRRGTRKWLAEYRDELSFDEFLTLGELLLDGGRDEEARVAIAFAAAFPGFYTPRRFERLGGWFERGIAGPAASDALARTVLSRFLDEEIVPPEALEPWRESPSPWRRRAVPVTLVFTRESAVPLPRQLEIVSPLLGDPTRPVRQGVARWLRATRRRAPQALEALLPGAGAAVGRALPGRLAEARTTREATRPERARGNRRHLGLLPRGD